MYILVLGIIFCCWEASFAALLLCDKCNHSQLFLSCLMCCEGSQDPYVCPRTTKPLSELFLPRMHEVVCRVEPLEGETAVWHGSMWQGGRHCSAAGAGAECNYFVLCVVPSEF